MSKKSRSIATDSTREDVRQSQRTQTSRIGRVLQLQRTIGNRATRALIQRQDDEKKEGSISYLGSADINESAKEDAEGGFMSDSLTDEQAQDKTPSDKGAHQGIKAQGSKAYAFNSQHPNFHQSGVRPDEVSGQKKAVYVGNDDYDQENGSPFKDLGQAIADKDKVKGMMEARGYRTQADRSNLKGAALRATIGAMTVLPRPGDAVFFYFAGHGMPGAMAGVDYGTDVKVTSLEEIKKTKHQAKYAQLHRIMKGGAAKGAHMTAVIDACHSGSLADYGRKMAIDELAQSEHKGVKAINSQIARLRDLSKDLDKKFKTGDGKDVVGKGEANRGFVKGDDERGFKKGKDGERGFELGKGKTIEERIEEAWKQTVRPELEVAAKAEGIKIKVPERLSHYSVESVIQQINLVLEALIALALKVERESKADVAGSV